MKQPPQPKTTCADELPKLKASQLDARGEFKCPQCSRIHGVWYYRTSPDKVELRWRCDRVRYYWYDETGKEHWKYVSAIGDAEFVAGLPVREEWARSFKKKEQQKNELQLLIPRN